MEIIVSIILAIIQSILFYGKEIGISMLLFEIILNGIVFYILHKKNKIQNKLGILLIIPILLLSSTFFIFANKMFYIANIIIIIILNLIMYVSIVNKKQFFSSNLAQIIALIENTIEEFNEGINYTKEASKKYIKGNDKVNKKNIESIVVSLLVVLAVVAIVLMLLVSADMVFANLFSTLGSVTNIRNILKVVLRIVSIIIAYLVIINFILKIQKEHEKIENKMKENKGKDTFTIKLLLITLNVIYLVFCFIQVQSLFAKVSISYNYAIYARKGFFQLMFVSLINLGVIIVSNRYNEKNEKIIKILNLLLVLFTIIIAMSSMYRMYMYQMEYGLTYLRMFVYIILITEIIAFIPITIYIFNKNFDYIKWCFIIGITAYCITNYLNIENLIISKNLKLNNTHEIDYEYISDIISEDSFNILEKTLEGNITTQEKLDIKRILLKVANKSQKIDWQEFNISKYNFQKRNIDIEELKTQIEELEKQNLKEIQTKENIAESFDGSFYNEKVSDNETYFVKEVDKIMGTAVWKIGKLTDNGKNINIINTIEVTTPSKIKFFENGLGFIEKPTSIYCGKAQLLVTHDSGKNFETIEFPNGEFSLSDPDRTKMGRLL